MQDGTMISELASAYADIIISTTERVEKRKIMSWSGENFMEAVTHSFINGWKANVALTSGASIVDIIEAFKKAEDSII